MTELILIPVISILDVHDAVVREWLEKLDISVIRKHLDYPIKLDRSFPGVLRKVIKSADKVHAEIINLMDDINPQAVFFDISMDYIELENNYNKRVLSPFDFWKEYSMKVSAGLEEPARTIYNIYMRETVSGNIRLIESTDSLPLSVVFYGLDNNTRKYAIPIYEDVLEKNDEFLLRAARTINEVTPFKEKPGNIWYSPPTIRHGAISYEETERFCNELLVRLKRELEHRIRSYIVRKLGNPALDFLGAYEPFLDYKINEDEIKLANIIEGLELLKSQSDYPAIVIFCDPQNYTAFTDRLKNDKKPDGMTVRQPDLTQLLDTMKPFIQKSRIMQYNYNIALKIAGREKPERFNRPGAVLTPA